MGPFIRNTTLILLLLTACGLKGQRLLNYRLHFSLSPSVSTGARFEDGSRVAATPNVTGTHYLYPLFSILWGRPNPQYTPLQNFARKFNYGFLFELMLNHHHSLTTGFEIGARGYGIHSDQSDDFIVMYRNINMPLFYTYTNRLGNYWKWRAHAGVAVNRATSVPKLTFDVIEIKKHPTFYPTVFAGLELSYLQTRGPFSYGIEYHHGFKNVIDHRYYALDYVKGQRIYSNGSHFRLNIKWFFLAGSIKRKERKHEEDLADLVDPLDEFSYRNQKFPVNVTVKNTQIRLCIRDNKTIDHDSVALELNGALIAHKIALKDEESCFLINLDREGENKLIIHALNLGDVPPNTYELVYYDGDDRHTLLLRSDMQNSSTVSFRVEME